MIINKLFLLCLNDNFFSGKEKNVFKFNEGEGVPIKTFFEERKHEIIIELCKEVKYQYFNCSTEGINQVGHLNISVGGGYIS